MIDGMTGMMLLGILFITVLLCRYSYYLGFKAGKRDKPGATSEFISEED